MSALLSMGQIKVPFLYLKTINFVDLRGKGTTQVRLFPFVGPFRTPLNGKPSCLEKRGLRRFGSRVLTLSS